MPKKDTIEFLNIMVSNAKKQDNYYFTYSFRDVALYLESLSDTTRKSIVSDSYWNKYPKYISWRIHQPANIRAHGRGLDNLLKHLSSNKLKYPKTYRAILKYSKGIILNFAIDSFSGSDKTKLAKRGLNSNDPRVRKACVRILPTKLIEHLTDDSDWGIRSIVATRISPFARPDLFINSKNSYARIKAISASEMDRDTIFNMLNERINSLKDWQVAREVTCLLDKLSDDDLLYFVNASGKQKMITDYFNDRLS